MSRARIAAVTARLDALGDSLDGAIRGKAEADALAHEAGVVVDNVRRQIAEARAELNALTGARLVAEPAPHVEPTESPRQRKNRKLRESRAAKRK